MCILPSSRRADLQPVKLRRLYGAQLTDLLKPSNDLNDIWRAAGFASGQAAIEALGAGRCHGHRCCRLLTVTWAR